MDKRAMAKTLRGWPDGSLVFRADGTPRFGRDEALALADDLEREAAEKEAADAAAAAMPAAEVAKQLREVRDGVGYPGPIWARAADAFIATVEAKTP